MNASDLLHREEKTNTGPGGGGVMWSMLTLPILLVQAAPSKSAAPGPGGWGDIFKGPFVPVLLVLAVWMFMMSRSSRKKQKQKQNMLDNMKRGDRVQTIGGVLGTVVEARDKDVIVKVDEGNNTKIKFARGAIDRIVEEEKA